ncbi:MAG: type II toxin-antitoxin system YafQ family toxin [Deltaproteobacteria bacterium]|nr:type II toxin-antitoxin system YafQ family toxin [Deltaproteobacteria bacterium]
MRAPSYTKQFERDLRLMIKRNKDIEKIKTVIASLIDGEALPERYRDHILVGNKGRRECHIQADWLLVYKLTEDEIIFERTGAHADLFR